MISDLNEKVNFVECNKEFLLNELKKFTTFKNNNSFEHYDSVSKLPKQIPNFNYVYISRYPLQNNQHLSNNNSNSHQNSKQNISSKKLAENSKQQHSDINNTYVNNSFLGHKRLLNENVVNSAVKICPVCKKNISEETSEGKQLHINICLTKKEINKLHVSNNENNIEKF